jgi:cytochrome o ubiquinol oxidase subunit 2
MKKALLLLGFVALFAVGIVTTLYLRDASIPILEPAGPIALAERGVIIITVLLCAIVVIPVFFLLFFFAWKYRADSPRAHVHHHPDWDHNNKITEFAWWLVPTAIIVVLGVIMWRSAHALDPWKPIESDAAPITVYVVALDWKWLFIYPDQGIASVNLLEMPENVPVHFYLTADAPMNSFWIPSLGGQIMVMPGMTTQLSLMASRLGNFNGFSANISGDGFAGMAFTARSVSQSDFQQWVQSIKQSSNPLTLSAYATLVAPSEYNPVAYYSPVEGSLYTTIVNKFMMPQGAAMGETQSGMTDMQGTPTPPSSPVMPGMNMPMNMPMSTTTP